MTETEFRMWCLERAFTRAMTTGESDPIRLAAEFEGYILKGGEWWLGAEADEEPFNPASPDLDETQPGGPHGDETLPALLEPDIPYADDGTFLWPELAGSEGPLADGADADAAEPLVDATVSDEIVAELGRLGVPVTDAEPGESYWTNRKPAEA